jgi:hypothetical protein
VKYSSRVDRITCHVAYISPVAAGSLRKAWAMVAGVRLEQVEVL